MKITASKLLCLFLSVSALAGAVSCKNTEERKTEPVTVKVQKVQLTANSNPQVFIGHVSAGKSSLISASYPGLLVSLGVQKGKRVRQGDTLAIIDSPTVKSMYETAQATYSQAKDALERVNQVYGTGSVSEVKLKDIQTSYAKAEAALSAARRALDDCTVKAPYDGVVDELMAEEGLQIGISQPLMRMLDVRTVEVHASIPEKDYSNFRIGQKATVEVDAVGENINATLISKGYEASPLSHSYDFVFRPYRTGRMMPGMVCKVHMASDKEQPAASVTIPSSAVRVDQEGRYVWCIDSCGTVLKKHIVVNGFASDGVVVQSGLSNNDMVVIQGGRRVSSGMKNIRIDECE